VTPERVANLADARLVLQSADGTQPELWSPENAAEIQGVLWFVALQRAVRTEFPERDAVIVLDCGGRGDLAIEALRLGLKAIALDASQSVTAKVADIATACGARLYAQSHISVT
jgi:hypothetical protein